MSLTIAIIGRPNVGKSTLFNRLVGKRLALVDDQPGVTRDLREGEGRLGPLRFVVIDTAGLEAATDDSLPGRMRRLTERAIDRADLCLLMIDARAGVLGADQELAELVRRKGARALVLANKAEGAAGEAGWLEAFGLGLGEALRISAEHGEGMEDLLAALIPHAEAAREERADPRIGVDVQDDDEDDASGHIEAYRPTEARPLQVAVIGRPNAGKSTLVNRIIGEDRLLTGPEAGITRDAISVRARWGDLPVRIFDTAGLRRKSRVADKVEKLAAADALRAVRFAEVVLVVLDATHPFEAQDLRIADLAEREGRAVVVALNKWDLVEGDRGAVLAEMREAFDRLLPQLRGAPVVAVSALTGRGLERLAEAVAQAHERWNVRIPTARLNRWLEGMVATHPPPAPGGRRIRLRYATQVKTRPPGFVVMCSRPEELPDAYRRYLIGGLREDFGLWGTPIRFTFRSQAEKNPYRGRKARQPSALAKHLASPSRAGGRKR